MLHLLKSNLTEEEIQSVLEGLLYCLIIRFNSDNIKNVEIPELTSLLEWVSSLAEFNTIKKVFQKHPEGDKESANMKIWEKIQTIIFNSANEMLEMVKVKSKLHSLVINKHFHLGVDTSTLPVFKDTLEV